MKKLMKAFIRISILLLGIVLILYPQFIPERMSEVGVVEPKNFLELDHHFGAGMVSGEVYCKGTSVRIFNKTGYLNSNSNLNLNSNLK